MTSLLLRNLFFTILQPGIVAGLIPFWIVRDRVQTIFNLPLQQHHYSGSIVFVIGFVVMLICIISFAVQGRGTLSPAAPTKKLVISGLYKYSRNPMYVGVSMMLIGEAILFQSAALWMYAFVIIAAFNTFIIFFEEPRLKKDFGEEYNNYCEKVRRWF
jgi:protein-S-isoprenylcysteine O-methyltransferase Ste14